MRQLTTSRRVILIVTVLLLVPAVVMAAIDSFTFVNSGGTPIFRIDLYGIDESNPPAVTYKYAVTDLLAGDNALSHWTLDLEQCAAQLASPTAGNYSTIVDPAVCGAGLDYPNCVSTSYKVVTGNDPTTGLFGIKFEGDTLGFGQTHIFHITVSAETGRGPIDVAVKPGNSSYLGSITGPLCTPTAVTMSGASVASSNGIALAAVAALTMVLGVASIGVWRKNEK